MLIELKIKKTGGSVSSFYKNKLRLVFLAAFTFYLPVHADAPKLNDGYYADYPETHSTNPVTAAQVKRGEYLAKMGDCIKFKCALMKRANQFTLFRDFCFF